MFDEELQNDPSQVADAEAIDIQTALLRYSKLVIVGDPGSGKSTFLKYVALMLARSVLQNNPRYCPGETVHSGTAAHSCLHLVLGSVGFSQGTRRGPVIRATGFLIRESNQVWLSDRGWRIRVIAQRRKLLSTIRRP